MKKLLNTAAGSMAAFAVSATSSSATAAPCPAGQTCSNYVYSYSSQSLPAGGSFAGQYLFPGDSLIGNQCYFHLDMQTDGNLVTYEGPGTSGPWWATMTNNPQEPGGFAVMQSDGNFVVYTFLDPSGTFYSGLPPVWASNTAGNANDYLVQQDDGNLVVYNKNNNAIWSSQKWLSTCDEPGAPDCPVETSTCQSASRVWEIDANVIVPPTCGPNNFPPCVEGGINNVIANLPPSDAYVANDVATCGYMCNACAPGQCVGLLKNLGVTFNGLAANQGCSYFDYNPDGNGMCTLLTSSNPLSLVAAAGLSAGFVVNSSQPASASVAPVPGTWLPTQPAGYATSIAVTPTGIPVAVGWPSEQVFYWQGTTTNGGGAWVQDGNFVNGAKLVSVDISGNFYVYDTRGTLWEDSPGGSANWQALSPVYLPPYNGIDACYFWSFASLGGGLEDAVPCSSPDAVDFIATDGLSYSPVPLQDPLGYGPTQVAAFGVNEPWVITGGGYVYGLFSGTWVEQPGWNVTTITDHYGVGSGGAVYWWNDSAPNFPGIPNPAYPGNWQGSFAPGTPHGIYQIAHAQNFPGNPLATNPMGSQARLWAIDNSLEVYFLQN